MTRPSPKALAWAAAAALAALAVWWLPALPHGTALHDPITGVLYGAFAGLCAYDATTLYRATGRVSRDVLWVCALSAVFVFCAATGYIADWLGAPPAVEDALHVGLNAVTLALVVYTVRARPIRRINAAEQRAKAAEDRADAAGQTADNQAAHFAAAYVRLVERNPQNLVVYDRGYTTPDGETRDAGRLIIASQGAADTLGYSFADLAGLGLGSILHPDDVPRVVGAVAAAARGETAEPGFRTRYKAGPLHARPGSWLWLAWDPPQGVDAPVEGVPAARVQVSAFRDVTAEVEAEARREEAATQQARDHAADIAQAEMRAAQAALGDRFRDTS